MRYHLMIGLVLALLISACGYKTDLELPEEENARLHPSLNLLETARIT